MNQQLNDPEDKNTICQLLSGLHEIAVLDKRPVQAGVIKECYIMAKKMNKKLCQYKYGSLPIFPNNSWDEKDWERDLVYEHKSVK